MFRNVHPDTHMYKTAINVKEESLNLKEQGKVCGKKYFPFFGGRKRNGKIM